MRTGNIAVVGTEDRVHSDIERFADSGVTDLLAVELGLGAEHARTRELLRTLL